MTPFGEFANLRPEISRSISLEPLLRVDGCFRMKMLPFRPSSEPVVITGLSMITSVGEDRESTWCAMRAGASGIAAISGLPGIPENLLLGAPVRSVVGLNGELKSIALNRRAAEQALDDARLNMDEIDRDRFACAISGHMGDARRLYMLSQGAADVTDGEVPAWKQWLPNTACSEIGNHYGLAGPRYCHSTACASGLIDILAAVRAIRDNQCDIALAGSAEAFTPLVAAGFHQMRVLAHDRDPSRACRPFDRDRSGFVMGEGAAMFVLERLSHARSRGASIYAAIDSGTMLGEAHHITNLSGDSGALSYLITETLRRADIPPDEVGYINAHGTATRQNDLFEVRGIRAAMGRAASDVLIGANKSSIGHLVSAAGSVELALTVMALRDGFAPPTLNLFNPDPECDLDCVPLVERKHRAQRALKLSCAFGGHLVCVLVSRWNEAASGFDYPDELPKRVA